MSSQPLALCERCSTPSAEIIECRRTRGITRRRRHCNACGHRFTTYELNQHEYQRLTQAAERIARVEAALGFPTSSTPEAGHTSPCAHCAFATDDRCSFGYPEFGTPEASDCTMYTSNAPRDRNAPQRHLDSQPR